MEFEQRQIYLLVTGLVLALQQGLCKETIETLTGSSGILMSPNYPDNYENNQTKIWKITVPNGHRVELIFYDFNLEYSDYVYVRRDSITDCSPSDVLYGTAVPHNIWSNNRYMCVTFFSDYMITEKGFNATFLAVPVPVNGRWTQWGDWSECDKSCGGGYQKRKRHCTNPPASHGGNVCTGPDGQGRSCNTHSC